MCVQLRTVASGFFHNNVEVNASESRRQRNKRLSYFSAPLAEPSIPINLALGEPGVFFFPSFTAVI